MFATWALGTTAAAAVAAAAAAAGNKHVAFTMCSLSCEAIAANRCAAQHLSTSCTTLNLRAAVMYSTWQQQAC
jgi:hypothetical protein